MDLWTSPADRRAPFGACGQPVDNALGRVAIDRAFPPRVAHRLPTLARLSPTTPQLKQQVFSSRRREKSELQKGDISTLEKRGHFNFGLTSGTKLISTHLETGVDMKPHMPTSPQNMTRVLYNDGEWWSDNADDVNERFSAWLAR